MLLAVAMRLPAQPPVSSGGHLDNLATLAKGWGIYAPFSNQTCAVQFYADGSFKDGQFLGQVETLVLRPDVNSALGISGTHGFSYAIPLSLWDGQPHTIYAYATSPDGTQKFLLGRTPATFRQARLGVTHTNVQQIWFAPGVNTNAFLELFSGTNDWPNARANVRVLKLPDTRLLADQSLLNLPNLFAKLNAWHIDLALESGAVKEWGCTADKTIAVTSQAIDLVAANGGTVKWIAMDEPLVQTEACHCTDAEVMTQTVAYVNLLKQKSSSLSIGDIEPWPACRYSRLTNWITGFSRRAGYDLAFFHLDVDLEAARTITPDLSVLSELPQLAAFCKSRAIPFGVIIWQANVQLPVTSNQAFCDNALYWAQLLHSLCDVDHAILQSWEQYPDQNVPDTLPYSFTHLLKEYATKISGIQ